ncbi:MULTISPECIES: serine hydrolase domain-containing protein [unclassified Pseudoalteromonas]|uniref:serine hydrolase domain-containing protein n=1 Tax=unclassified Pseudoalteromonas TaxID=194690 RepID=UPI002097927C|nr:serine hydrolase domain-containing protein [Pseudoalteromonas sp. XMcav2-N]MCO7189181.1 beta-lactamase family protein [Pseudoalteromonas sp. XMcav2-N]
MGIKPYYAGILGLAVSCHVHADNSDFDATLACYTQAEQPGIAVRIEQGSKLLYSAANGLADIESKQPLHTEQVFQIGSITKQFTAAAILQLAERNKLSLQDPLGKFIPSLSADYGKLTLDRVLSHTSGLPNYNEGPEIGAKMAHYRTLDQILAEIVQAPVLYPSGEGHTYSNTGYLLLGKIIEQVSGLNYKDYLQQHIFTPLGMKHSQVLIKGTGGDEVKGYSSTDDKKTPVAPFYVDRSWIYSAGGIETTLADMSRWHRGLKAGKVVSPSSYQAMITSATLNDGSVANYGYGFYTFELAGQPSYFHEGGVPGFLAMSVYFPEDDLFATVFSNQDTLHPGPALLDMVSQHLNITPKPLPDVKMDHFAKTLVGEYQSAGKQQLKVTFEEGILYGQKGQGEKRKLVARANNAFSFECTQNYYQLSVAEGKTSLTPVGLYRGKGKPLFKL